MLGARRRGPLGLVALLVFGLACLLASAPSWAGQPASPVNPTPGSSPNPTSTNVPYLAWKGENIRVVKCSDDLTAREMAALRSAFSNRGSGDRPHRSEPSLVVEDWSGAGTGPRLLDGTREFFLGNSALCARGTFTSTQAGLARIKMAVGVGTWNIDLTGDERAALVTKLALLQHQFLAGWMNMSDPQLTELPLGGDGPNSDGNPLGSGMLNTFFADNVYSADSRNQGVLQAKVTGSMPVDGMGTITLPDAWPAFAAKYATDANPNNENPSNRWDIHDQSDIGSFTTEGHPFAGANCTTPARPVNVTLAGPILDAVDNCDGGQAFSRVFDADGPGGDRSAVARPDGRGHGRSVRSAA